MRLIENRDEWLGFRLNTEAEPVRYPVVAWYEETSCGIAGDYCISFHAVVPENIPADQLESWLAGFEAGQRFSG